MMEVDIFSLFPEFFASPLATSMMERAQKRGMIKVSCHNIRDFATGKHRKVDDKPYGGGGGMLLMPEPVCKAIRSKRRKESKVIYLSAQGKFLTAEYAQKLAKETHLILLCGHYEGVDQRAIEAEVDEEISIGPYVLCSGCLPALVLLEATARFLPGFLGYANGAYEDSYAGEEQMLEGPSYTRPASFEGKDVPQVLREGAHAKIRAWRIEEGKKQTERQKEL